MKTLAERPDSSVDWAAAEAVAERLGVHTRLLVVGRAADAVRKWALKMSAENVGGDNGPRSASYLELAVLAGHVLASEPGGVPAAHDAVLLRPAEEAADEAGAAD